MLVVVRIWLNFVARSTKTLWRSGLFLGVVSANRMDEKMRGVATEQSVEDARRQEASAARVFLFKVLWLVSESLSSKVSSLIMIMRISFGRCKARLFPGICLVLRIYQIRRTHPTAWFPSWSIMSKGIDNYVSWHSFGPTNLTVIDDAGLQRFSSRLFNARSLTSITCIIFVWSSRPRQTSSFSKAMNFKETWSLFHSFQLDIF